MCCCGNSLSCRSTLGDAFRFRSPSYVERGKGEWNLNSSRGQHPVSTHHALQVVKKQSPGEVPTSHSSQRRKTVGSMVNLRAKHVSCSVVGCSDQHKTLHKTRVSEDLRREWIKFIFDGEGPAINLSVCAKHLTWTASTVWVSTMKDWQQNFS